MRAYFIIFEIDIVIYERYKTIDYILRATWQVVSRMYNEEASKYGATMATGLLC
jgi:hypothetical protein